MLYGPFSFWYGTDGCGFPKPSLREIVDASRILGFASRNESFQDICRRFFCSESKLFALDGVQSIEFVKRGLGKEEGRLA